MFTIIGFSALIVIVIHLLWRFYNNRVQQMSVLKKNNIPGPKPHFIWGNMPEYYSTPNVLWDSQLIEQYGPICGYYIGTKPVILIADPVLIQQIQATEGGNFLGRPRRVPGGIDPDPVRAKMLGNLEVAEWKNLRRILTPSFTPLMLKYMTKDLSFLISDLMKELYNRCQDTKSVEVDIYPMFQNFTLNLIGRTGFGVEFNFHYNSNNSLREAVDKEFLKAPTSLFAKLCLCFPNIWFLQHLRIIFKKFSNFISGKKTSALWNMCCEALRFRIDSREERHDILQTMLNSKLSTDSISIIANSVLFFEAAFETLSAGLAFTFHLLIKNPIVQEKVRDEIRNILQQNGGKPLDNSSIIKLKYLDAVIKESLRLYPPQTTFITRSGEKDFEYIVNDEILCTIPKGVQIQVALYQIQNSATFWDQPEIFKPERHLKDEKHSMYSSIYQPFGNGQRKCIGHSYAKLVLPTVLAEILSKYSLSLSSKTEETITLHYKTATMTPKNGCYGEIRFDPLMK